MVAEDLSTAACQFNEPKRLVEEISKGVPAPPVLFCNQTLVQGKELLMVRIGKNWYLSYPTVQVRLTKYELSPIWQQFIQGWSIVEEE